MDGAGEILLPQSKSCWTCKNTDVHNAASNTEKGGKRGVYGIKDYIREPKAESSLQSYGTDLMGCKYLIRNKNG